MGRHASWLEPSGRVTSPTGEAGNVLVDNAGSARVVNLGLVGAVSEHGSLTRGYSFLRGDTFLNGSGVVGSAALRLQWPSNL